MASQLARYNGPSISGERSEAQPIVGARSQRAKDDDASAVKAANEGTPLGSYLAQQQGELSRRRTVDSEMAKRNVRLSATGDEGE